MDWYLVQTKPRQEKVARQNLERQRYECYLPMFSMQKIRRNTVTDVCEPLFPRYLFIKLGDGMGDKGWSPIRSTLGVSKLVCFGTQPAKVTAALVDSIRQREQQAAGKVATLFQAGQKVQITDSAFAGIEGIFQTTDSERRVLVLIEMMSKPVVVALDPTAVRKAS
ncbi:transcription/translation regulatory transformer protein RfaH [Curvibacter sp. CHRR-16]|nr:transcription/translation regulatory transformer protein RfaH [Curvibacter sp. CHRR-16]